MITVTKQENGVLFTFENSDKYLYGNGTIEVPFNSLSIIMDESDNITLRKSASNDIFLSARYDTDFGYSSKEEAVEALKSILYDEAGISQEEVQDMIDSATSGMPSSQVVEQLRTDVDTISGNTYNKTQIDGFLNNATTMLTTISGDVQTNAANIQDINDTIDEKEEVIASALTQLRQDVSDIDEKEEVIASALTEVRQDVNKKADASAVTTVSNDLQTLSGAVIDNEYTVSQSLNDLNTRKLDVSAYTPTDLSQYWTSAQTQSAIDETKAYYIDFGVLTTQGIHDADWDGLVNAINAHRPIYAELGGEYYVSECLAQSGNQIILTASNHLAHFIYTFTKNDSENYGFAYETKPYVTDAEKATWNAKQDALSAGTGIEISGNVISATGGGGGSVTVDDALSTTSENPVANSAITNGFNNYTCFSDSLNGEVRYFSFSTPNRPNGKISISNFSINGRCPLTKSNGTNEYIDKFSLVETSAITTSMTSSSTDVQVPSAKAVYDTLGGLKLVSLTQAQYSAMEQAGTLDNSTLYIVTNVGS